MFCCKKSKRPSYHPSGTPSYHPSGTPCYHPSGTPSYHSWETQILRPSGTSLLVAAIDFGTTYSGWAFSFKHEFEKEPEKVSAKNWTGGQLVTLKAPTTVLIKPDGKTLDSFGYEAESKYAELTIQGNNEHETWYYFHRFKMMLHEKMELKRDLELEDETKKTLPAKTVFSLTIRYLKEDMLNTSRDRLGGDEIREDEITWVLTVPAIWNDAAKQFMREAAVEAGIKNENLKIALEPEAASIFCRLLPVEKMEGAGVSSFIAGSRYMVLDAGGGTIDITIHEVMPGGQLKELYKATGGAWGGTEVDEAYKQFIISLVGNPIFQRFCKEHKDDHIHIFRDFEIKKRGVSPEKDSDVIIRLPFSLKETYLKISGEDLCNSIKQTRYANEVSLVGDKLRIHASVIKGFFAKSIENTISHVKELMKNDLVQTISGILMVGGYSESKMLQNAIKDNFSNVKVIVPYEASLVVLKGAVIFGHTPSAIAQRVCRYTYGFNTSVPFDPRIHDINKSISTDDGLKCTYIFQKHVEIGQAIIQGQPQILGGSYWPTFNYQTDISFEIYCSNKKSPMYVTDEGCIKLGQITVLVLDMSVPIYQREFVLSMSFSGTEIEVSAKEKRTGRCTKTTVNFLG